MNTCSSARKFLLNWGTTDSLAASILFGSDGFPNDGTSKGQEAVSHVQNCEKCKLWLRDLIPVEKRTRMERLINYCCPQMFVAVEEPSQDNVHITLRHCQEQRLWGIQQPGHRSGLTIISFCPWCGRRLPPKPFIDDDRGVG